MAPETVRFREVQPWWLNHFLRAFMPLEAGIMTVILLAVGSTLPPRERWVLAAVWLVAGVAFPAAFLCWRLVIEVGDTRLRARFAGLPGWTIPLDRVETAEVIRVDPLRDFGGWGWRRSRAHGPVLNVAGNEAVRVRLVDGTVRTLGTQRAHDLAAAILAGALGEPEAAAGIYSASGVSKA